MGTGFLTRLRLLNRGRPPSSAAVDCDREPEVAVLVRVPARHDFENLADHRGLD